MREATTDLNGHEMLEKGFLNKAKKSIAYETLNLSEKVDGLLHNRVEENLIQENLVDLAAQQVFSSSVPTNSKNTCK